MTKAELIRAPSLSDDVPYAYALVEVEAVAVSRSAEG